MAAVFCTAAISLKTSERITSKSLFVCEGLLELLITTVRFMWKRKEQTATASLYIVEKYLEKHKYDNRCYDTPSADASYLTGTLSISGSLAVTIPTRAPNLASSWTSMMVPEEGMKMGASSTSDTLTLTMVWSRNDPRSTKRGSTCLFTASTTTLCERLLSKSRGYRWERVKTMKHLVSVTFK